MLPSFTPPGIRDRRRTADDVIFGIGTGSPAAFLWETADANANAFLLRLPTGGATDVPVFIIGDASAENVDLGMFNGFTQPLVATLDADQDSYVGFHYSGDDVGIITMRLGSGGTIRNHVIPDVASSTIAVLGAAQTWSGAQTFSADPQVNADLDFVGPQAITTTSGALTITPATDTRFSSGNVFINDTAHSDMNIGLAINEGGSSSALAQAFVLKSSDINTGLTTLPTGADVDADDYFTISKLDPDEGGVRMQVLSESGTQSPFILETWGGDPATTDATSSLAAINFFAGRHNGSNADADMSANTNLLVVGEIDADTSRLTRLLLKADDGELHLGNTTAVALDSEEDILLVRAMQKVGADGGIVETEYDNPYYDYGKLQEVGLAGEKDSSGVFLFPLQRRLHAHEGTMWQTYCQMMDIGKTVEQLQEKLALAESKLEAIGG